MTNEYGFQTLRSWLLQVFVSWSLLIAKFHFSCLFAFEFTIKKLRCYFDAFFPKDYHFGMLHEDKIGKWSKWCTEVLFRQALKCGEVLANSSKWLAAGVTANSFVDKWRFPVGCSKKLLEKKNCQCQCFQFVICLFIDFM